MKGNADPIRRVLGEYVGMDGATWEILDCGHHVQRLDEPKAKRRPCWKCGRRRPMERADANKEVPT